MNINNDDNIERPALITCVCITGWIFALLELCLFVLIPEATNYTIAHHHAYFHWLVIGADTLLVIALYGIWRLRIWGLFLYVFVSLGYFFGTHHISLSGISITDFAINTLLFLMLLPHIKEFG